MKSLVNLLIMVVLIALTGCGGSDECVINCEIEGLGNKGIELIYADRGVKRLPFHPVDGKVEMRVDLPRPAMLEAFTLDNRRLFCIIGRNGDHLTVKMKIDDPSSLTVEGNEASASYARITAANDSLLRHGSEDEINALVTREIHAAPGSMASTMLLMNYFHTPGHELRADSLLNTITADARPTWLSGSFASLLGVQLSAAVKNEVPNLAIRTGSDTTVRFNSGMQGYGLLVFDDSRKPDSITSRLRKLRKDIPTRRLAILDISLARDTALWQQAISRDSATWQQAWVPGGVAGQQIRNLAVAAVPFYIVTDSTGRYLYRGRSLYCADTMLRARIQPSPGHAEAKEQTDSAKSPAALPAPAQVVREEERHENHAPSGTVKRLRKAPSLPSAGTR